MAKETLEIRITFKENQKELYDYIKSHSSSTAFIKDLTRREMLRDEAYINGKFGSDNSKNNNTHDINHMQYMQFSNPYQVMNMYPAQFMNMNPANYMPQDMNYQGTLPQQQFNQQEQQQEQQEQKKDVRKKEDLKRTRTKRNVSSDINISDLKI